MTTASSNVSSWYRDHSRVLCALRCPPRVPILCYLLFRIALEEKAEQKIRERIIKEWEESRGEQSLLVKMDVSITETAMIHLPVAS